MKTKIQTIIRRLLLGLVLLAATTALQASTDYPPAIYRPMTGCTKWYTSGYGHKLEVIHDIEGYYWSTIGYLNRCDVNVSIHFLVNGKQDTSTDAPAGEISQSVRTAYYAWHAVCLNTRSYGTEHEGFASNPAWYTEAMYQASAGLQRYLADGSGIPKDRNHIVAHGEWQNTAWVNWCIANMGFDPRCNSHTDPGPYWNWSHFMSLISPNLITAVVDNSNSGFSVVGTWSTGTASTDKYGGDYRFHSTAAISEPATWTASLGSGGTYKVYAWWTQGSNRSASAPYIVAYNGGTQTVSVNQQGGGGAWNQLGGTFGLNSGANNVKLSCWTATGYVVVADAVKWVQQ